jgi:hypothetical protein
VKASFLYEHERKTFAGLVRSYTPVVHYEYVVDGTTYESKRRNFLPYPTKTYADRLAAEAVVTTHAPDKAVQVYYNPNNPRQAVLEIPKPRAHNAQIWYGVTNVLCGIGIMVLGIVLS